MIARAGARTHERPAAVSTTIADVPLGTGERSVNPLLPSNEFIPDGEPRHTTAMRENAA